MVLKRSLYAQNVKDPNVAEGRQAAFKMWDQRVEGFQPRPPSPREPQRLRRPGSRDARGPQEMFSF